jgi:1-acyl-sn-glycerol-3-phosphate acyltransferase
MQLMKMDGTRPGQGAGAPRRSSARPVEPRRPERRRRPQRTAGDLDVRWAHGPLGDILREAAGRYVLGPLMSLYARRQVFGRERVEGIRGRVVIVANHVSHMDTPALLRALPREWRKRTVVAAAVDYFYRSRAKALFVSLLFNTVPIERRRDSRSLAHIDELLEQGSSLILYPEGTRSRRGAPGRLRPGAAVIAARHGALLVPVRIRGTHDAMPPGTPWMRRRSRNPLSRHPVTIEFGEPIAPSAEDTDAAMAQVAAFFEQQPA